MAQVIQKAVEHSIRLAERGGGNVGGVSQGRGILKAGGGVLGVNRVDMEAWILMEVCGCQTFPKLHQQLCATGHLCGKQIENQ